MIDRQNGEHQSAAEYRRHTREKEAAKELDVIHPPDKETLKHHIGRISILRDEIEATDFPLARMELREHADFLTLLAGDDPDLVKANNADPWKDLDVVTSILEHRVSIEGIGRVDARPQKEIQMTMAGTPLPPEASPKKRGILSRILGR